MTTKIVIPKTTHYGHIIRDSKLIEIIDKSSDDEDITKVIDQMTRKYLRQKHPNRVIEGQERVNGKMTNCWYEYK